MDAFFQGLSAAGQGPTIPTTLITLLLAYVLAQLIAFTYAWTQSNRMLQRNMVQALVVAGIVAATLMLAIGNSLARGIGIVGTLALIRFRTNLRDPLDMVFVFAAFGAGIAAGTQSHVASIIGTLAFVVVMVMLKLTGFGSRGGVDGVLTMKYPTESVTDVVDDALASVCASFALMSLRESGQGKNMEARYRVTLRDGVAEASLLAAMRAVPGVKGIGFDVASGNEGTL